MAERTLIRDRDAGVRIIATETNWFLGVCPACNIPLRDETKARGNTAFLPCPTDGCNGLVKAERLSATLTAEECDPRCMGATGPICSCGCGGANHGGSWGPRMREGEAFTSALRRYQEHIAATNAKRIKRAEAKAAKERSAYQRWAADNADVVEFLTDWANCTFSFLDDMRFRAIANSKPLSDAQANGVRKCIKRQQQWAARDAERAAERAAAKPVPTGTVTVTGRVLKAEWRESGYGSGGSVKMTIEGEDGWLMWGTAPREILPNITTADSAREHYGLKGALVEFTATVKAKPEDATFGYLSRPRKARIIERAS